MPYIETENFKDLVVIESNHQKLFTAILQYFNDKSDRDYPYQNLLKDDLYVCIGSSDAKQSLRLISFIGQIRLIKSREGVSLFESSILELMLCPLCTPVHFEGSALVDFRSNGSFSDWTQLLEHNDLGELLSSYIEEVETTILQKTFTPDMSSKEFQVKHFHSPTAHISPLHMGESDDSRKVREKSHGYAQLSIFFQLVFKLMMLNDLDNSLRVKVNLILRRSYNSRYQIPAPTKNLQES
jgi:hypothetical protein